MVICYWLTEVRRQRSEGRRQRSETSIAECGFRILECMARKNVSERLIHGALGVLF
ncbi:hypothetical protein D1AOALGA4SA_34 [Olavius algarvensis Delta 1 endosymbiont]|nr:hypothetical protein D1AOALGA4SA_34 [Olavius algarvensis Delta 1 endosymbiont]